MLPSLIAGRHDSVQKPFPILGTNHGSSKCCWWLLAADTQTPCGQENRLLPLCQPACHALSQSSAMPGHCSQCVQFLQCCRRAVQVERPPMRALHHNRTHARPSVASKVAGARCLLPVHAGCHGCEHWRLHVQRECLGVRVDPNPDPLEHGLAARRNHKCLHSLWARRCQTLLSPRPPALFFQP